MADASLVQGATKRTRSESPGASHGDDDVTERKHAKTAHLVEEPGLNPTTHTSENDANSRGRSPSEEGEERDDEPPLPDEEPPPLPDEESPETEQPDDDGWEPRWDYNTSVWYYFNKFTGISQWENPRIPDGGVASLHTDRFPSQGAPGSESTSHTAVSGPPPNYMGYNPKIHGDFDPNADYAKFHQQTTEETADADGAAPSADELNHMYQQSATFNRFTGSFQSKERGPEAHNDENKSKRQMEAFFDVDKAANAHEGRSLKAQRQRQKLSKQQIQEFNNKKKAKKIKKDRDWLTS